MKSSKLTNPRREKRWTSFASLLEELEERDEGWRLPRRSCTREYEKGYGVVGEPDNDLYPGWNPKKVVDFI
jgi:hypothetical protein